MRRTTSWPTSAVAAAVLALAVTPVCVPAPAWADGGDRSWNSGTRGAPASDAVARTTRGDEVVGGALRADDGSLPEGDDSLGEDESASEDEAATEDESATDSESATESDRVLDESVPDGEPVPDGESEPDADAPAEGDAPTDDTAEGDSPSDRWAPDGLDAASSAETLELAPADARPGTTVTANTTACGEDRRATGDANSLGAGDFPLETGTHGGDLVGRFVVPAGAPSGTFPITVGCENGTEVRARLTVSGGAEPHGVQAGDGGSLGRFSTTQLVLGWMLITGSAGTAVYYMRRRHEDGWP